MSKHMTVMVDDHVVFSRDVEGYSSTETAQGNFEMQAAFPPVDEAFITRCGVMKPPTGTLLDGDIRLLPGTIEELVEEEDVD